MQGEELEREELLVPEPVGLPLHGADFVVGALQRPRGDVVVVPRQDAMAVGPQGVGQRGEGADPGGVGAGAPDRQERGRLLLERWV